MPRPSIKIERVVISTGISHIDNKKVSPSITKRAPEKAYRHRKDILTNQLHVYPPVCACCSLSVFSPPTTTALR